MGNRILPVAGGGSFGRVNPTGAGAGIGTNNGAIVPI